MYTCLCVTCISDDVEREQGGGGKHIWNGKVFIIGHH